MTAVRVRVAFRPVAGNIDPATVRVDRGSISCEVIVSGVASICVCGLEIDPTRHRVIAGTREIRLDRGEMATLVALAMNFPEAASHADLLRAVGWQNVDLPTRTHQSHVSHVRKKLAGLVQIVNVQGYGYYLAEAGASA